MAESILNRGGSPNSILKRTFIPKNDWNSAVYQELRWNCLFFLRTLNSPVNMNMSGLKNLSIMLLFFSSSSSQGSWRNSAWRHRSDVKGKWMEIIKFVLGAIFGSMDDFPPRLILIYKFKIITIFIVLILLFRIYIVVFLLSYYNF